MKILVACEFSGVVRDAFIRAGHDAVSCDIIDSESDFGPHIKTNVIDILGDSWDMMIAHPPCTYLCNSGVRWLHERPERWIDLDKACAFFKMLYCAPIPKIAIENPIMHKHAKERLHIDACDQVIQPWMFGHPEKKATCLWLKGLDPLEPVTDLREEMKSMQKKDINRAWYMSNKDRAKTRSKTFYGIAEQMAKQWC